MCSMEIWSCMIPPSLLAAKYRNRWKTGGSSHIPPICTGSGFSLKLSGKSRASRERVQSRCSLVEHSECSVLLKIQTSSRSTQGFSKNILWEVIFILYLTGVWFVYFHLGKIRLHRQFTRTKRKILKTICQIYCFLKKISKKEENYIGY